MESSMVFDYSHITTNLFVKNENIPSTSQVLDSLWVPNPSPFHGSASTVNFDAENNTDIPFGTEKDTKMENCNEDCDESFQQPEKKRRLLPEQVKFLEKSFEVENKLEPERKIRLAKQLGLEPRQVTIWFQNRRARYRTKLLEKEFNSLKGSFDKLKQDCDSLSNDNEKLKIEVQVMREKLLGRENGMPKTEPSEPISPILDVQQKNQISASNIVPLVTCNQEGAASSAKSDVLDSTDSPHYKTDVALLDVSDVSQDENGGSFLPKLEVDDECYDDLQPNSCSFGFPVQEQGTWFWQY